MYYYIIYKPYGMLSQFSRETPAQVTLADLATSFPKDVYPVGRLDSDSEGLLLLTNDKTLNARLLDPKKGHPRTYWVQVEGDPTERALDALRRGIRIRVDGKEMVTRPALVRRLETTPDLPERVPPIRIRKTVPDCWLEITLTEGKNRQVRRMCAAAGFPVLRLVRVAIGELHLQHPALAGLQPGDVRAIIREVLLGA
ncbi:MAG: pseudouridine synthase [Saprospiraceae bacterium]